MLKWSNLEFTFEVGGSLVAADAMFLEPCLNITCKAPTLYGDPSYDSDDSTHSEINKSSISTSLSSPVLTSSNSEPELKVIPPIFSFLTINTWLLATWTFQPNPRYLRNMNLSKVRDAPIYIWNLPAGVCTRESIKGAREDFIKSLYTATNQISTNAAANTFINKIGL